MGLSLMNMLGLKRMYRAYSVLLKILPFALYKSSVSTGFAKQIMPTLHVLMYNSRPLVQIQCLSELLYDRLFTAHQFALVPSPLSLTATFIFNRTLVILH
jgi:hypothetical protein